MEMLVRSETAADHATIDEIQNQAFGQPAEGRLVRALRDTLPPSALVALVLEIERKVVGHILFSPVEIIGDEERSTAAVALAPLAVLPAWQRRGIGTRLMREGLAACRRRGDRWVIVVGHAAYYPRFGFKPARAAGLEVPFPASDASFMVCDLAAGADGVEVPRGMVRYASAFSDL